VDSCTSQQEEVIGVAAQAAAVAVLADLVEEVLVAAAPVGIGD
jgi:hypothetical protein